MLKKLTFCALEIEYLGYILESNGINSESNKVQAILMIKLHKGVKPLRHFVNMVQYYPDTGQDKAKCSPLYPNWLESAVRPKLQRQKEPNRYLGIGTRSIKEPPIM